MIRARRAFGVAAIVAVALSYQLWPSAPAATAARAAEVRDYKPVTDAMIANPSPNDWLSWRGTSKSLGYSPLNQINRSNVGQLQVAWSWQMEPGSQEPAMLAHDGIIYLPSPGAIVQALDGATGDLIWEYRPPDPARGPRPTTPTRGLAIYDNKIFVTRPDAHVVALDARTGKVVWDVQSADPAKGFSYRAAPVVARGKVVSGLTGCTIFQEEKCAIIAHDAKTGKEMWRISMVPKPGEPGDETWAPVPYLYRAGMEMWIPGSYDAELNLVYMSTSQAKPWTRFERGTDGDTLYANTTFAINPDTGKVVWYRQLLPGETHDFDEVYENVLVDIGSRKTLFKMGKMKILWEIDRRTGKMVNAIDTGWQNLVDIDRETFATTYRPDKIPKPNVPVDFCPGPSSKTWPAIAYAPETQAFYIPHMLTCVTWTYTEKVEKKPGGGGVGNGPYVARIHEKADGKLGELLALTVSGKTLWAHRQRPFFTTSVLTTGGGLVFAGDYDRYVNAYDAKDGKLLWRNRVATSPEGYPMSYAVRGRQYIAFPIGIGGTWASSRVSWGTTDVGSLIPEVPKARPGNALVVFALPESPKR